MGYVDVYCFDCGDDGGGGWCVCGYYFDWMVEVFDFVGGIGQYVQNDGCIVEMCYFFVVKQLEDWFGMDCVQVDIYFCYCCYCLWEVLVVVVKYWQCLQIVCMLWYLL